MSPISLPPLREVIARHGLDARKALGQHFLLDGNITDRIVRLAGDLAGRHVLEVGPGPGGLTRSILQSAATNLTAIEVDHRAIAALEELLPVFPDRLQIVKQDATRARLTDLVAAPRVAIANLPYNVATPLLIEWLRHIADWEKLVLMFQLEVAERICAPPGSDAYGRLSVLANFVCHTDLSMRLPAAAFTPPPKVWSAVVTLTPRADQPSAKLLAAMEKVTAAAFGQRRKMLRGSLKTLGGVALLESVGIDPERRAETLSVAEFQRLAEKLV